MSLCGKISITPPKCKRKERRRNYYSRCSIVAAATMSWRSCVFSNMVRGITFPSHIWGSRPITTHWIAGQSEHTGLFRMISFVKINAFQKTGQNVRYVENNVFLNLQLHKHIALHQIHKIMFFLATSYDPFKNCSLKCFFLLLHCYKNPFLEPLFMSVSYIRTQSSKMHKNT